MKGSRRVGSLDPNTVEFITMYKEKNMRSTELKEEIDAVEGGFEATHSDVLSVECFIHNLGLYHGYMVDTGLFN